MQDNGSLVVFSLRILAWQIFSLNMQNKFLMQNLQNPYSETVFSWDSCSRCGRSCTGTVRMLCKYVCVWKSATTCVAKSATTCVACLYIPEKAVVLSQQRRHIFVVQKRSLSCVLRINRRQVNLSCLAGAFVWGDKIRKRSESGLFFVSRYRADFLDCLIFLGRQRAHRHARGFLFCVHGNHFRSQIDGSHLIKYYAPLVYIHGGTAWI